jgi:hypothetical protein
VCITSENDDQSTGSQPKQENAIGEHQTINPGLSSGGGDSHPLQGLLQGVGNQRNLYLQQL